MDTDKELLGFFYQKRNISLLEATINSFDHRHLYPAKDETEDSTTDPQTLFDELVYPEVHDILSIEDLTKPELRIFTENLFEKSTADLVARNVGLRFSIAAALWGTGFSGIGSIYGLQVYDIYPDAPFMLGLAGGILGVSLAALIIPVTLYSLKGKFSSSKGFTYRNTIYVKDKLERPVLIHALAHETAHAATYQCSTKKLRQSYLSEGLAEAVAIENSRSLESKRDRAESAKREFHHLNTAYHHLCKKLGIESRIEDPYKKEKETFIGKLALKCDEPYDIGYTAVHLLQLEHCGTRILKELITS